MENLIPGHMSDQELDWLAERARKMSSIVEIGAFKGRTTYELCSNCPGVVVAVDDFRGIYNDEMVGEDLYAEFWKNCGHFKNLITVKAPSVLAAEMIGTADMVFIDGTHEEDFVVADLLAWKPHVKKLLCGHDYTINWPGVVRAVDRIVGPGIGTMVSIWYKEIL